MFFARSVGKHYPSTKVKKIVNVPSAIVRLKYEHKKSKSSDLDFLLKYENLRSKGSHLNRIFACGKLAHGFANVELAAAARGNSQFNRRFAVFLFKTASGFAVGRVHA